MSRLFVDVTNVVNEKYVTGIQRVAREFGIALSSEEDTVFLKRIIGSSRYHTWTGMDYQAFYKGEKAPKTEPEVIGLDSLKQDDIFLDFDSVWNNFEERRNLIYPKMKEQGVRIVTLVYDVLPVMLPHLFNQDTLIRFLLYLSSVLSYTDTILVNAQATKNEINHITDEIGLPRKEIKIVPLGANFSESVLTGDISEKVREASEKPFLLMLGTIEPRKNHAFVLDAFEDGLRELPINLVFAGREGWNVSDVMTRIRNHRDLNDRFFFLEKPSDREVNYLYEKAWGIIFASSGEGFGLPVIEALSHGKLVFSSDIEVLREIGGESCFYFELKDKTSLIDQIAKVMANPAEERKKQEIIRKHHVMTWKEAGGILKDTLRAIRESDVGEARGRCAGKNLTNIPEKGHKPRQLYLISARADDLAETLPFYDHFLPFLEEIVVGCPARITEEIRRKYQGRFRLTFVTDEELLKDTPLPDDHQARNLLLRALTIQSGPLDEVFIMADDDNRPLRHIEPDFFMENGKFNLYYCYPDLKLWHGAIGNPTSYDRGIRNTWGFLAKNGLPTKQYSSHAPQVICKSIYCELLESYPEIWGKALDEWSIYGNYACAHYGDFFINKPYCTMNWPGYTYNWKVLLPPEEYVFENFYREMYEEGGIFEKYSQKWHERIADENMQKVQIRMQQQEKYEAGEKEADLCDKLYARIYHHDPVWRADLDHGMITVPKILMGPQGHMRRVPFTICNKSGYQSLMIEGRFTEKDTGRTFPFQNECVQLSGLDGDERLCIFYPDWNGSGNLQLTFTVDGKKTVRTVVPVLTY